MLKSQKKIFPVLLTAAIAAIYPLKHASRAFTLVTSTVSFHFYSLHNNSKNNNSVNNNTIKETVKIFNTLF